MTPEGKKALDKIRASRGYTLPLHDVLAEVNPELLRRYGDLATFTLFGEQKGRALDLKTRFLVLVGVTTAVKGDREGLEWSATRAIQNGATWNEVREAAFMAALPAGIPAFENACRVYKEMAEGKAWVKADAQRGARKAASGRKAAATTRAATATKRAATAKKATATRRKAATSRTRRRG